MNGARRTAIGEIAIEPDIVRCERREDTHVHVQAEQLRTHAPISRVHSSWHVRLALVMWRNLCDARAHLDRSQWNRICSASYRSQWICMRWRAITTPDEFVIHEWTRMRERVCVGVRV